MLIGLLFVLFVKTALGNNILRIHNVSEFIDFSKNANHGSTVFLDSDLSLSGKTVEPINYFHGVFDGQGHTISNLAVTSSSLYVGLFGYSKGLTIRNVVIDSSCSLTSNYTGTANTGVRVGGLIGDCQGTSGSCIIENIVNMADITFNGNINFNNKLYLGGIAGYLSSSSSSSSYDIIVKNCANYGSVTHSGKSTNTRIGGIVGHLFGTSYKYLYTCLNYGAITHSGKTSNSLCVGGIAGFSNYGYIEKCVSAGKISSAKARGVGSIVGYVDSYTNINYCYYTNGVGVNSRYGTGTPTTIVKSTFPSIVNSTLIAKLNERAKNDTWNKWLLNENNASVSFIINYGKGFTVNSQIILLPGIASNSERIFSGWYTDANLNTLFNLSQVESNTTLYGMFCGSSKYTVTFDVNGGNNLGENEVAVGCMGYYELFPENVTRTGHTFIGWFTERERGGDKVESGDKVKTLSNHTLYAHWVINNYTVTFDFDNGTALTVTFAYNASIEYPKDEGMKREGYIFVGWNETVINMPAQNTTITALWRANNYTVTFDVNGGNTSETPMIVTFNSPYGPLPEAEKPEYMFLGWFTDSNENIKSETIVKITDNHTLYAHWEKTTNQVEVVFNAKDLSKEDIEKLVKKYTDAEFAITGFGEETGEIRVIVKFADNEAAVGFVRSVNELSMDDSSTIKRVGFAPDSDASFALLLHPTAFISSLI